MSTLNEKKGVNSWKREERVLTRSGTLEGDLAKGRD